VDNSAHEINISDAPKQILKEIEKGNLSPCYLLYGEEDFLIRETLDKIINAMLPAPDRDLNLFLIEGEQEDIDGLCQSLLMPPLIAGKKVVVLKNTRIFLSPSISPELIYRIQDLMESDPDRSARDFMHFLQLTGWSLEDLKNEGWKKIRDEDWQKVAGDDSGCNRDAWLPKIIDLCVDRGMRDGSRTEGVERLADILKSGLPGGNHLIVTAGAVDKRKKIYKVLSETGKVLHFPQIKTENRKKQVLMDTVKESLAKAGKTVTPAAWMEIGKRTGFIIANSMEAVEKLIIYTGEKTVINEKDVDALIGKTKEGTIFDLTNALSERDIRRSLIALKELLDQGIHELAILSMMAREIRLLLHAGILIKSGKLDSFNAKTDYVRFQKSIYPRFREWTVANGKKDAGSEFFRQHPYVMYQALKNSKRFSFGDLRGFLGELVDMDIALKSTSKNPRMLLERFIVSVCSSSSVIIC
jgi:DNA polymerase III subunit delta